MRRAKLTAHPLAGTLAVALVSPLVVPLATAPTAAAQSSDYCVATMLSSESALAKPTAAEEVLQFRRAWPIATGAGVKVAVIDTGVAANERLGEVTDGGDLVDGTSALLDCDGHGTLVAGIVAGRPGADGFAGVAPGAEVLSIRQTAGEVGNLETLAQAIDIAIEQGARVINISLTSCAPPTSVPHGALEVTGAVLRAEAAGAVVVAAAGNTGGACEATSVVWPAVLPEVLAVSAVEFDDAGQPVPASYAMVGRWVDVSAPGGPILGPDPRSPHGLIDRHVVGSGDNARAQPIAGTSFATPTVSGTAALILSRQPELTPAQVREIIVNSASPISSGLGLGRGVVSPTDALAWTTVETAAQRDVSPAPAPAPPAALTAKQRDAPLRATGLALMCLLVVGGWLLLRLGARPGGVGGVGAGGYTGHPAPGGHPGPGNYVRPSQRP